jgi:uncharacterized protein (TIGR03435 family)
MRTVLVTALFVLAMLHGSIGQSPSSFEVASIKRSSPGDDATLVRYGGLLPDGRWVASHATLEMIVRAVYRGHDLPEQVIGLPSWALSDRFDITAKVPAGTPRELAAAMARNLLAERFQLVVRTETRELPAFALTFARPDRRLGPGMKPAAADCEAIRREASGRAPDSRCMVMSKGSGGHEVLTAGGITMARLAALLGPMIGRQITDDTGSADQYDVTLTFAPDAARTGRGDVDASGAPDVPPLATALREQLGVKLESARLATEVMVVERVEPPTPD